MSVMMTLSNEEGGKSESHTLAWSAQYQLLKWVFIIIIIIISLMEQSELSNILCLPNYIFLSFWHQHSLSPGDLCLHPLVLVGL